MFKKTSIDMLKDITMGVDIKSLVQKRLAKKNSTIVIKYYPARSISPVDIMMVMDDVLSKYGNNAIKALYVDYLDKLKMDMKYDLYRIMLADIATSLKSIAVEYNVPVITATQLSRGVYKVKNAHDLSLDMMSESIDKVNNADCVILMAKDKFNDDIVHMMIGKNRAGKSNIYLTFDVKFEWYKFIRGFRVTNDKKENNVTTIPQKSSNSIKFDFNNSF